MKPLTAAFLVLALLAPSPAGGQEHPAPAIGLHLAALQGNLTVVRQHITAGSDLNAQDAFGSTPLIVAAAFDRTDVALALIEAGADLDLANRDGGTALHTAAFLCRIAIVRALLDHGANRYVRDRFGNTALESVVDPFVEVQEIYDTFAQALGPLGLQLDYVRIRDDRPRIAAMLRPAPEELDTVEYAPPPGAGWAVSTPAAEGLDPRLVAELYLDATGLPTLYGLLAVRNGRLIAERYFNGASADRRELLQSATKSYTSALVGLALERGCLSTIDQRMLAFFPEIADRVTDPRKALITIRQLLQMRAGFPWEETDPALWDALLTGDYLPLIADVPLVSEPGTAFHYSNLTSHWLGVIVARACETDLKTFAQEHLLAPLRAEIGEWRQDRAGYHIGGAEIRSTARDAAKFGLLYLNDGVFEGTRVVPEHWIEESLQRHSEDVSSGGVESGAVGRYFRHIGYGYQWWSAQVGEHHVDFAWGHGGQLILVLDALDMVIVVTSDPFYLQHDDASWQQERAILNLVGKFIASLPSE